jgi:argininosuccinate synthase
VQAAAVVRVADAVGATAIAHGSTGAGNDQVRFDGALRALAPSLDILTPIRAQGLSRQASTQYLEAHGHEVPVSTTAYSVNRGLWGNTIGGAETLTTHAPLPEAAYEDTTAPADAPATPARLAIMFEEGLPTAVDGEAMDGVALVKHLHALGAKHGIGRGMHVGDTILGIKGRVGFEAPAATILITAHRELEKVVLTQAQQRHKAYLAEQYGRLVHEGHYLDPVLKDIEAYLDSSQRTVAGEVTVALHQGRLQVLGCTSPFSLFDHSRAAYGEANEAWDGRDARGFSRIYGLQAEIAHHVHQQQATHA